MNDQNTAVITAEPHAMTLASVLRHVELVEHVLQKVMKENVHYGASFPGDTKKNLLKPGADKLCLAFQLAPTFDVEERALAGDHREYRVTCKLTTPQGRVMGEGVGTCSTMESKYRWRNSARKCPECQKETIIKGKEEYGGGWLCFPKKGGCGAKWPNGAKVIESQDGGKVENADIADVFNTCLKIGKKRAYVDATITATAASDLFTQDIEDLQNTAIAEEKKEAAREEQRNPPRTESQPQQPPAVAPKPSSARAAPSKPVTHQPQAADGDASGERMQAAYRACQKFLGARAAACVWAAYKVSDKRDERLRVLVSLAESCQQIVATMGADPGNDLIRDEVDANGNDQMTPEQVKVLVDRLEKQSNGEVLP